MLNVAVVASPPVRVFVLLAQCGAVDPWVMVLMLCVVHLFSSSWSPAFLSVKR